MKEWVVPVVTSLVLVAVAAVPIRMTEPPSVVSRKAPPERFSAERALDNLRWIAREPHPVGSAALGKVRAEIVEALRGIGLEPEIQVDTAVRGFRAGRVENVIAVIPGTRGGGPRDAVLLAAHYDSVPMGPGAGDAGAAVATVLETARALMAGPPLRRDVILLLNGSEETFLLGATAFMRDHPLANRVGFVVNMDPGGVSGPAIIHGTSPNDGWLMREVGRAVPRVVASSLAGTVKRFLGDRHDDFLVFEEAGAAGVDIAFVGGDTRYHSALDCFEAVDPRSIQHLGDSALGLVRHFANLDALDVRAPDCVYFNPIGTAFVHYPARWSIVFAIAVLGLGVGVVASARRRGLVTVTGVAGGSGLLGLSVAAAVAAAWLGWRLLSLTDRVRGAFLTGDQYQQATFTLLFVALAVLAVSVVHAAAGRRVGLAPAFLGAQVTWAVLAVAATVVDPGSSFLVVWPAAITLTVTLSAVLGGWRGGPTPLLVAAGLPAVVLWAPLLATVTGAVGTGDGPFLMAGVALLAGLQLPALKLLERPVRWGLPAAATVCATLALVSVLMFRFDAEHPRTDFLVYGLDADTGNAVWAVGSRAPGGVRQDAWTARFVDDDAAAAELRAFYPYSSARFLQASAPVLKLAPPEVEVLGTSVDGERPVVRMKVRSPRGAAIVIGVSAKPVLAWRVDGRPIDHDRLFAFFDPPSEGFELDAEVDPGSGLELVLIDQSYGLPGVEDGGPGPRPPGLMPEPSGGLVFADATLVRRRVTIVPPDGRTVGGG